MPTGKRASMREGPLAALFRKTAEDTSARERRAGDAGPAGSRAPLGARGAAGPSDAPRVGGDAPSRIPHSRRPPRTGS